VYSLIYNYTHGVIAPYHKRQDVSTVIDLSHIEKIYDSAAGPVHALKDISLHINKGEIYGIIGLSGAGKSTLVRCINLLERPTKGTVTIEGKDITAMTDKELRAARKGIGMIFQHFNLLSTSTVFDNIAFPLELSNTPKEEIKNRVTELLELVGLANKADQYPSQLSGGQKQRVGIARALASNPQILLCDEATSALDPQTTKSILELIKDINHKLKLTVVVITHEMQVIKEICDKVAVIDKGVIAEQGDVLDVFINPQQPITKEFISVLLSNELPVDFRNIDIAHEPFEDSILLMRLTFIGETANDPIISSLVKKYDVSADLFFGSLDDIKGAPFGRLIIGLDGSQNDINAAMDYLREQKVKVEVIGYVSRHASSHH
jgi:D-methionine transport system ATP-binding protein